MLPPIVYKVLLDEPVAQFVDALDETLRGVVLHYLDLIARRLIAPEIVQSYTQKTYMVTIPSTQTPGWPNALRIVFRVRRRVTTVTVIDMGDHNTSVLNPGKSVYPDER
jgi:hypothetical protein